MALAMTAGICTSIILETIILSRTQLEDRLRTAVGMSLISMIGMETAMNAMDWALTGGARLTGGYCRPCGWRASSPLALQLLATRQVRSILLRLLAIYAFLIDSRSHSLATFGREYI